MFCDLVGSTSISAQLDAEEWRDLVASYLDAASAAVTEMGGHVAKKLGDGLLSLFGYPVAHENDAERAARAALAIQRALAELNHTNAGIGRPEAAPVSASKPARPCSTRAARFTATWRIPRRACRRWPSPVRCWSRQGCSARSPGSSLPRSAGAHALKGVPEPMALYRLIRASGGGRRSGQRQLTPLVGRDDEMAMLMRRWERAQAGDGQFVLIVGEPGLGKSRLIEEFHAGLADRPHTWVEWSCSQLLQNTPLHPIAEWGRQRFGSADVPTERRLADLDSSLQQVKLDRAPGGRPGCRSPTVGVTISQNIPPERAAFGPSGGYTAAPGKGGAGFGAEEFRRRQLAALNNWMVAGARVQPVVLAFEDLHWADPTTIDVIKGIAERGALPRFLCWRQHDQSSSRPGARARIKARFRSCRSTVIRCGIWWARSPLGMSCRST